MKLLLSLLTVLMIAIPSSRAAEKNECPAGVPPPNFGILKKLVGKWEAVHKNMMSGKPEKVVVTYRLTAGGTALIETLFPGTPHEMVSVYHGDGDDLVMTHYCMLGNQPMMRCEDAYGANPLKFEFDGGTGIKSSKDPHMRALTVTFVDKNHFKQEWVFFENGKPKQDEALNFSRVR